MEKETERLLGNLLHSNTEENFIFNSYNDNKILKHVFDNCSKKIENNRGFPDKIYYDGNKIIVFECKPRDLNLAINEAKYYVTKMKKEHIPNCEIYACGFVNNNIYTICKYNCVNSQFSIYKNSLIQIIKPKIDKKISIQDIDKVVHNIHNYIRNNTKISNDDKALFIGGILIALKDETFKKHIILSIENDVSSCIIFILKKYNIDIEYIYTTLNNYHLLKITKMVLDVVDNSFNIDLLNNFYNEFVKYQNTDSKSLGIVLTPSHIVKLMIKLLNLNKDDVFLDLCTGTGSFLCESYKYKPKKIIGCEYQKKLYFLLQINNILRDSVFECINKDCFDEEFKVTKSAINPPYGMKDKTELDFLSKQLDSLEEKGLCSIIIPCSCIDSKKNMKKRNEILSKSKIKTIIKCNKNIFYPTAGVGCYVCVFEKNLNGHDYENDNVEYIDYTDDGFEIKTNNGRVKIQDILIENCNKVIFKLQKDKGLEILNNINYKITKNNISLLKLEQEFLNKKLQIMKIQDEDIIFQNVKKFKISDLFDILSKPVKEYQKQTVVPYICAKNNNNGIKYYDESNTNTFEGNKIVIITGGDGGAGLAFYQENDFNILSVVKVLSPKWNFLNTKNGIIIAKLLSNYKQIYSRSFQWSIDRIQNDTITLPMKNDEIDFNFLENM